MQHRCLNIISILEHTREQLTKTIFQAAKLDKQYLVWHPPSTHIAIFGLFRRQRHGRLNPSEGTMMQTLSLKRPPACRGRSGPGQADCERSLPGRFQLAAGGQLC